MSLMDDLLIQDIIHTRIVIVTQDDNFSNIIFLPIATSKKIRNEFIYDYTIY